MLWDEYREPLGVLGYIAVCGMIFGLRVYVFKGHPRQVFTETINSYE